MKKLIICLLVIVCLTGLCFAAAKPVDEAAATWTDGTTTFEGTLVECFAKASEAGGTVTLQEDAAYSGNHPAVRNGENDADYTLGCYKAFTLDLNGKTLTTDKGGIYVNGGEEGGVFTMKNGTIYGEKGANVNVRNLAVQFDGVTLWSDKSYCLGYYVAEDTYNKDNLIENCTFVSGAWFAISFNDAQVNQEKASLTVINSTLACLKFSGSPVVGLQTKPEGSTANIVYGEGVKLYSMGLSHTHKAVSVYGEPLVASVDKSVTLRGEDYEAMNEWATPEKPSVEIATLIPGETAPTTEKSPALRKVELTPFTPPAAEEPAAKEETAKPAAKQPAAPAQEAEGGNLGIIIAVVAAVVVIAVVAVVVLKKKKQ